MTITTTLWYVKMLSRERIGNRSRKGKTLFPFPRQSSMEKARGFYHGLHSKKKWKVGQWLCYLINGFLLLSKAQLGTTKSGGGSHCGIPTFQIGHIICFESGFTDQQIVEKRGLVSIFEGLMELA